MKTCIEDGCSRQFDNDGSVFCQLHRPPEPYGGVSFSPETNGIATASTGPHLLVSGPTGIGKTRRVLAPAAITWRGPVVCVSSKDDLLNLVAPYRVSGAGPAQVLDLRDVKNPHYEGDVRRVRTDPTVLIKSMENALVLAEQLIAVASVGTGGSTENVTDAGLWDALATQPLAGILWTASPVADQHCVGTPHEGVRGIEWALDAIDNLTTMVDDADAVDVPGWSAAATICAKDDEAYVLGTKIRSVLALEARQRDSVAINTTKALDPWVRPSIRNPGLDLLDPTVLDSQEDQRTLYIIPPETGAAAAAAVSVIDALIQQWRLKEAEGRNDARLLFVIDELPNTAPLPKLATYIGEARGLGVNIVAAVQASSQLARKYGAAQLQELRDVFPATMILHGAPEQDMLDAASFWSGLTDRRTQNYDQATGGRSLASYVGATAHAAELAPPNREVGRLLVRGTPGKLVAVPDMSVLLDRTADGKAHLFQQVKKSLQDV